MPEIVDTMHLVYRPGFIMADYLSEICQPPPRKIHIIDKNKKMYARLKSALLNALQRQ